MMATATCPGCLERDERIGVLERRVARREAIIHDLNDRLGVNASNSGLPPSANPQLISWLCAPYCQGCCFAVGICAMIHEFAQNVSYGGRMQEHLSGISNSDRRPSLICYFPSVSSLFLDILQPLELIFRAVRA